MKFHIILACLGIFIHDVYAAKQRKLFSFAGFSKGPAAAADGAAVAGNDVAGAAPHRDENNQDSDNESDEDSVIILGVNPPHNGAVDGANAAGDDVAGDAPPQDEADDNTVIDLLSDNVSHSSSVSDTSSTMGTLQDWSTAWNEAARVSMDTNDDIQHDSRSRSAFEADLSDREDHGARQRMTEMSPQLSRYGLSSIQREDDGMSHLTTAAVAGGGVVSVSQAETSSSSRYFSNESHLFQEPPGHSVLRSRQQLMSDIGGGSDETATETSLSRYGSPLFHDVEQVTNQPSPLEQSSNELYGDSGGLNYAEGRSAGSFSSHLSPNDFIEYEDGNDVLDDVYGSFLPEFQDAGDLDSEGYSETPWAEVDTRGVFVHPIFTLYTRNEQDRQFASECIRFGLIWLLFYNPIINGAYYGAARIAGLLTHIIRTMLLFVVFFSRGAAASGRSWQRVRGHLMKYDYFRILISGIEDLYEIGRGGLIFNQSGKHRWHHDKFQCLTEFRAILSLLCSTKVMWFRDERTGAQFGIHVPHCAFIVLTRLGSGAEGSIGHRITGGNNSFLFTVDFGHKKESAKEKDGKKNEKKEK